MKQVPTGKMRKRPAAGEDRSITQLHEHYTVEHELAQRLRQSDPADRLTMYGRAYDELYRRIPHHPRMTRRHAPEEASRIVDYQLRFLRPYLREDTTFLEVGAGDCGLALAASSIAGSVLAADVSRVAAERDEPMPRNFRLVIFDGVHLPLEDNSVDVAYSNQVIEHVHPDDAELQTREIYRCLKPGGTYLCVTSNALNGPHDISQYFDSTPTGFHLKEYTFGDMWALCRRAGFSRVIPYVGIKVSYLPLPALLLVLLELGLRRIPSRLRLWLAGAPPVAMVLGVRVAAIK